MPTKNARTYMLPLESRRLLAALAHRLRLSHSATVRLAISELAACHKVR